jgi:hypothetical protein
MPLATGMPVEDRGKMAEILQICKVSETLIVCVLMGYPPNVRFITFKV